jgi:hypothetical protein
MIGASVQRCRGAVVLGALLLSATTVSPAAAQHEGHQPPARAQAKTEPQPQPEKILGWEPIRCWRQISAGAVTIGQTFRLVLTCAAYEADNARVIPDESRLGVASIQLAPFEIVGGSHPPDVRRGSRRFFQYEYQLRIIGPDAIGHDVNIPSLTISYRIQSTVGAAATLQGRDLSYVMPMMPIKVLSLVPADAVDIRDASEAGLGAVDALRFRSSLFRVLSFTFGALAAVVMVLALVPMARRKAGAGAAHPDRVPDRAVLGHAAADLAATQAKAARDGWDAATIAAALTTVRLVAAAAINQPSSQKPMARDQAAPEGRLAVRHGTVRRIAAAVSSPTTAADVARARQDASARFSTTRLQQLEGLQSALAELTSALYRKDHTADAGSLDEAVRHAQSVAKDIAAERSWLQTLWARR